MDDSVYGYIDILNQYKTSILLHLIELSTVFPCTPWQLQMYPNGVKVALVWNHCEQFVDENSPKQTHDLILFEYCWLKNYNAQMFNKM